MSISNLFTPNNNKLYAGDQTIGTLTIIGDLPGPNNSITSTQLYNSVIEESSGEPNSLGGYDNLGTFANVEVGTGLSLSGNVLISTGSGSGNVIGTPPSATGTPAIYTDESGLLIGSSSVTATNNTLIGYNGTILSNIIAGTNISISSGVINNSSLADVVGTPSSSANTPAIYTNSSGFLIGSSSVEATPDTLIGYSDGGLMSNITAGTNITISGNIISAAGSGTGDVNGPASSVAFTPAQFADETGKLLSQPSITATADTLIGYSDLSTMINITAGTNISISGGVISASAPGGEGDVTGPESSTTGALVIFEDTTGKNISEPLFSPLNNSLLGYNTTSTVENILIGDNLVLSDGVLSGEGNVTGPESSINGGLVLFNGVDGNEIQNSTFTPLNNSLLGYNTTESVSNITVSTGLILVDGVLTATATGSGDVSGPESSTANTPALFTDTSGKSLINSNITVQNNTLIGYNGISQVSNISAGNGITIQNGLISAFISPNNMLPYHVMGAITGSTYNTTNNFPPGQSLIIDTSLIPVSTAANIDSGSPDNRFRVLYVNTGLSLRNFNITCDNIVGTITNTELSYLLGATSNIQNQIDSLTPGGIVTVGKLLSTSPNTYPGGLFGVIFGTTIYETGNITINTPNTMSPTVSGYYKVTCTLNSQYNITATGQYIFSITINGGSIPDNIAVFSPSSAFPPPGYGQNNTIILQDTLFLFAGSSIGILLNNSSGADVAITAANFSITNV